MLRAEGFADVRYVETESGRAHVQKIGRGELDFSVIFAGPLVIAMNSGKSITAVAGVHPGCFELFGNERVRRLTDLKGKSVGVQNLGSSPHVFLSSMATYVGLDPVKDIHTGLRLPSVKPMQLFVEGKIDAFLGFSPEPQELRSRKFGHVIVNSAVDRPWSQYSACSSGNTDFVRQHPIATKRVVRAILKATEVCATEPTQIAQRLVGGFFTRSV